MLALTLKSHCGYVRLGPVNDLSLESADWSVGGSCPMISDRPEGDGSESLLVGSQLSTPDELFER